MYNLERVWTRFSDLAIDFPTTKAFSRLSTLYSNLLAYLRPFQAINVWFTQFPKVYSASLFWE